MLFQGPSTPAQFESVLLWRKKSRRSRVAAVPDVPEPRREDAELDLEPLDLYALSVGRAPSR